MHALQTKVRQVRRLAQSVRWVCATAWLVAVVLAMSLLVGLSDFLLRSEEVGVRLIFSLAVLVAAGWAAWRFIWPAATGQPNEVQVAQRIERRWPELQDRLSSSLEFLSQSSDEATAGSPTLRRTVVAQATAQVDSLPLSKVVDLRRPLPVLAVASVLILLVGGLFLAAPGVVSQAARRLAVPWSTDAWPRRHHLNFVEAPTRVPFGEPFRVEVTDEGGRLPEMVQIYYWFDGQQLAEVEPQNMKPAGERMVHGLSRVTRPFRYRAVGGDDDTMGWISVEVVEPPRVEELSVQLHPPEYTGWSSAESSPHIRALAGTTVSLSGRVAKPLASAEVVVESDEEETRHPLQVGDDGLRFRLDDAASPWQLAESGSYRLLLTGVDGVEGGQNDHYQIEVVPDAPPRVSVESPDANTFVTPDALVPIEALIRDDLAIRRVLLRFSRSDQSDAGEEEIVLYEGPPVAAPRDSAQLADSQPQSRTIQHEWDLANLDLPPGASLLFTMVAGDYRPQQDQSPPRRLTIITRDQLEDRISQRQSFILGQLADALNVQREARSQTKALQIQVAQTREITGDDAVDLQSAELNQRRVDSLLAGEQDGVLAQIDALLDMVRRNRVDNPDLRRRIGELRDAVRQIATDRLPGIQRDLLTAHKAAQNALRDSGDEAVSGSPVEQVRQPLDRSAAAQDEVISQLESLLGNLSKWNSYRRFSRQVSRLRRDQQDVAEETARLRLETLSRSRQQLSDRERAELSKLAQRQTELARRLEKMLTGMEQAREELSPTDPLAAETLADAVDMARRNAVSGKMHRTAGQIDENQLGQAAGQQEQIGEELSDLLDTLTGRREHQLGRQLEKLKEAADEVEQLQKQLKGLRDKTRQAADNPNPDEKRRQLERLKKERTQQQEQMERLARRLQRLQAERAAEKLSQAAEHSRQAGQAAEQGDDAGHQQQGDLAEKDLEQAQQEIARQIKQAERDLLDEQLARLEQSLKGMIDQQQAIVDETLRLDELRRANGSLTRGQTASVGTLARQQRGLIAEANDFADQIKAAVVFHLGLTGAIREMARAADQLSQTEVGAETQQLEQNAHRRLVQLQQAMQQDDDEGQPAEDSGSGGGSGNPSPSGDGIQDVAQLQLLKLMQQSLQQRTRELEQQRSQQGDWTDEQQAEIVRLAEEQGKLADLLFELSQPADEPPEDSLEPLPELDEAELEKQLREALEGNSDDLPEDSQDNSETD